MASRTPSDAVSRLDESDVVSTDIRSGRQMRKMSVVSEDGATDLVLESRKPEAKRFRRFLTPRCGPRSATPAVTTRCRHSLGPS
ncbi:hypothetical protein GS498_25480 [Rhodococcus hoagii]|nr:hypothetical protein [Prescottella equi]